jgi:hypothetical protein
MGYLFQQLLTENYARYLPGNVKRAGHEPDIPCAEFVPKPLGRVSPSGFSLQVGRNHEVSGGMTQSALEHR